MKQWVRWALIAVGGVVALVAAAAGIGVLLPRDHVASSTITLQQPADSVWRVVRDFAGMPFWWKDVTGMVRLPDAQGRERWRQESTMGPMSLEISEDRPPQRLATRILPSEHAASYGGTWTYEVAAADGGSRVTVTEEGWVANPLLRFVARTMLGPHTTMDSYLKALARRFGEAVEPVHLR
jgi:uncharacterized membrane protein